MKIIHAHYIEKSESLNKWKRQKIKKKKKVHPLKRQLLSQLYLYQWFSTEVVWQGLETYFVVTTGETGVCVLVAGRGGTTACI